MIIDEQVLPLQRIWCLFEVYHTIRLSSLGHFQGAQNVAKRHMFGRLATP